MIQDWRIRNRHTIARWNPLTTAQALGELNSMKTKNPNILSNTDSIEHYRSVWLKEKNLFAAIDFVSLAFIQGDVSIAQEAGQFISSKFNELSDMPVLMRKLLSADREDTIFTQIGIPVMEIARIKKYLINHPRDSIRWVELAWYYLIQGQNIKAEKALLIAYELTPNNRYIIRSISRFYLHMKEFDKALSYATRSDIVKNDPWTMSNQIAISNINRRTSKLVKPGILLLENKSISPRALSELASELGTMDFSSGNIKKGKRKFQQACCDPHENALAQVYWVDSNIASTGYIEEESRKVPFSAEAKVYAQLNNDPNWHTVLSYVNEWVEYQPFSKSPIILGSSVAASLLDDYNSSIDLLNIGYRVHKNDPMIINNYSYTYTLMGKENEAREKMSMINWRSLSDIERIVLTATRGLIEYRFGNASIGKTYYTNALTLAKEINDMNTYYSALMHLVYEERLIGNDVDGYIGELMKAIKYINNGVMKAFISKHGLL
jgi:tetratricopeptide (TPR) repeat protein